MELKDIQAAIEQHTAANAATIAAMSTEIKGLKETLADFQQRAADRFTNIPGQSPNLASILAGNDFVKAVAAKQNTQSSIEVKTAQLFGLEHKNTITNNSGDFQSVENRGVFAGLQRRRFLLDYLTVVPVATGSVSFSRETTFTNNAAVQVAGSPAVFTEGATKAESEIVFELESLRVPSVAHWIKASSQVLADVAQLEGLLNARLRYGLSVKLDAEIINGTGTAPAGGLTKSGNYTAFSPTTGDNGLDSINRAIAMLETADASATLVCLHPTTYRSLQRLKATAGEYLFGNPSGQNGEAVWNTAVLPTTAVTANKLLVLDTAQLGEYYMRENARVDVGYVDQDFIKNLVTIRAEARGALAVVRPSAVIYGTLTV